MDLDAAYKQMLVAKPSLWTSVLAIEDIEGNKRLFLSRVLPFGASASVYGFNRVVRALHCIGERLFGLVWCNYYDDYPQLDLASPLTVPVWNGRTHAPYEMEKPTSFHTRPILENGAKNP